MRPTTDELVKLRKGLRKRKVPPVFDSMWASQPGIGGFRLRADGDDFQVEWVTFEKGEKQPPKFASWRQLCTDPQVEHLRLEVGWLASDLAGHKGREIMDSIGGPNEAMHEAAPYWKAADDWRHWALVPAGHMLGLNDAARRSEKHAGMSELKLSPQDKSPSGGESQGLSSSKLRRRRGDLPPRLKPMAWRQVELDVLDQLALCDQPFPTLLYDLCHTWAHVALDADALLGLLQRALDRGDVLVYRMPRTGPRTIPTKDDHVAARRAYKVFAPQSDGSMPPHDDSWLWYKITDRGLAVWSRWSKKHERPLNELKRCLFDAFGGFADKRYKDLSKLDYFCLTDYSNAREQIQKSTRVMRCGMYLTTLTDSSMSLQLCGNVPSTPIFAALVRQRGHWFEASDLYFTIRVGQAEFLEELAAAIRAELPDGNTNTSKANRVSWGRVAATLEKLATLANGVWHPSAAKRSRKRVGRRNPKRKAAPG